LSFPIAGGDLPAGVTTGQLAVYWWNPEKQDWFKLGGVFDPLTQTLSLPVYHFSTYAVMADTAGVPQRLAGADRFLTANAIAAQGWKAGADNVVLVNAFTFADALAAAPLAFKLNAPILLTERDTLTLSTQEELQKLGAKKITLIGGTGVISQAIQDSLNATCGPENVIRYGGSDRYETAALIAAALGTTGRAVLANGEDGHYLDALAVSAYAAYQGIPILFTESQALPAATGQALTAQKVSSTIVVGGEAVVAPLVYNQLPGAERYAGANRYATATAIAEGLKFNPNRIYLATGLNFADALTAGNLAAHTLSPLIMVDQTVPQASADYLTKQQGTISELVIVGGEGIISTEQESAVRALVNP
jgi:putative cell wall-binding protein